MNTKRELIALAVRFLAENTTLVRKPDSIQELIATMFSGETYDQRLARELDESSQKALESAKQFAVNRKFKKITKDI